MASPTERELVAVGTPSGFQAHLNGVSVADLIQMSCLSNATSCVRILSNGKVGWIHFAEGRVVHASTGTYVGDDAVLYMLQWINGTLEPFSPQSPVTMSVRSSWQNLLLLAAQRTDESQHANVIPMTQRTPSAAPPDKPENPVQLNQSRRLAQEVPSPQSAVRAPSTAAFVRINASGRVINSRGDTEDLTALAAFSAHMGQMIADQLGLERLQGIEVRTKTSRTVVAVAEDGQVQAMTSTNDEDLAALRRSAGL